MKKFLSIILTLVMLTSIVPLGVLTASANEITSGTTGDCTWSLDGSVLTISGDGEMADYIYIKDGLPWGTNITEVVFEGNVTRIGEWAFASCYKLKNITIPNSVTIIGVGAFSDCLCLKDVTLPDTLTTIEDAAFYNCRSLESIYIPDSVICIGATFHSEVFYECLRLKQITVGENNPVYSSVDGVLFDKEKTKIITCPAGKVGSYIIPEGVTNIPHFAFLSCTNITQISIPSSVTVISDLAFSDCSKLTEVFYGGTIEDKEKINIGDNNYNLLNAVWYYNSVEHEHEYTNEVDPTCDICDGVRKIFGNHLIKENGKWFYYKNGVKTNATTLIKINGKWFYVKGGKWSSSVTDLVKYNGKWFYIQNGKWNNTIDTLHKINGKWFLIKGGKWDKTTGLVEYKGKTFLVKGGKWDSSVNTLYKKDGKFYAIKSGKWYTGKAIITYNGKKFYVNKGFAQLSFSGKVKIGSKTYTINKGKVS